MLSVCQRRSSLCFVEPIEPQSHRLALEACTGTGGENSLARQRQWQQAGEHAEAV